MTSDFIDNLYRHNFYEPEKSFALPARRAENFSGFLSVKTLSISTSERYFPSFRRGGVKAKLEAFPKIGSTLKEKNNCFDCSLIENFVQ